MSSVTLSVRSSGMGWWFLPGGCVLPVGYPGFGMRAWRVCGNGGARLPSLARQPGLDPDRGAHEGVVVMRFSDVFVNR